jgi:peptidoglycan/xylan/chitin deacetylase (PgdA/CDA1 family)
MRVGGSYSEAGYAATDNCDGDVTGKVSISGGPDVYQPGSYQIRYTVVDSYGNEASASRTVCVLPVGEEDIIPPTGKVIYLTFDDGPGPHTARLLDVLAKYNVKATFFVVNTGYAGTMARAAQEGHTVAMHTATHRYDRIYASEEAYLADLTTMQSIIEQHTGQKSMLFRFPGGSSNSISKKYNKGIMTRLSQLLTEQGYTYFDWNVDSKDAGGARTAAQVFSNVTNGIGDKSSSVVLQHDLYGFSVDAVEKIIVWGLVNGYTFLPLDASSPTCHHGINN